MKSRRPKSSLPPVLGTESDATVKKKPAPKTPPKQCPLRSSSSLRTRRYAQESQWSCLAK
uniref:Myosin light chain kinase n=1 Tax=Homo sapiens TaxID=9606 RepID=A0A8I5KYB9_HUMAN